MIVIIIAPLVVPSSQHHLGPALSHGMPYAYANSLFLASLATLGERRDCLASSSTLWKNPDPAYITFSLLPAILHFSLI